MKRVIFIGLLLLLFTGCFNSNKGSSEDIEENIITETIEGQTEVIITKDDLTAESVANAKNNLYGDDEAKIIRNGNEIEKIEVVKTSGKPSRIFKSSGELVLEPENTMSTNKIISKLNLDEFGYTKIEKGADISASELIEKIKENYPGILIDYEIRNEELYIKPVIVFEGETNIKEYLLTALFDVEYGVKGAEQKFMELQRILGLKKDIAIMGEVNKNNKIFTERGMTKSIKRKDNSNFDKFLGGWTALDYQIGETLKYLNGISGEPDMRQEKYLFPENYKIGDNITLRQYVSFYAAVIYLQKPKDRARMSAMYDWAFCSHYKHVGILNVDRYLNDGKSFNDLSILSASGSAYNKDGIQGWQIGYESVESWKNSNKNNHITAIEVYKADFGKNCTIPEKFNKFFEEHQGKPYFPISFSTELVYYSLSVAGKEIKIPDILIKFKVQEANYCSKVVADFLSSVNDDYDSLTRKTVVRPDDIYHEDEPYGYIAGYTGPDDGRLDSFEFKYTQYKTKNAINYAESDYRYYAKINLEELLRYPITEAGMKQLKEWGLIE